MANNDGWYDDTSDGPVTASVWLDGKRIEATGAWVVVAPPHYAPGVKTVRTLYDVVADAFAEEGTWLPLPEITYEDHVEPILDRFCRLQWVNQGFAAEFGWRGPHDFRNPELRSRLRDPGESIAALRRQVYLNMRDFARDGMSPVPCAVDIRRRDEEDDKGGLGAAAHRAFRHPEPDTLRLGDGPFHPRASVPSTRTWTRLR